MGQPDRIEPLHYLQFDPPAEAQHVVFVGEDGRAIVHLHDRALDCWQLATYIWPEALGALAGLLMLIGVRFTRRRLHRPQRTGFHYCRTCNYELGTTGPSDAPAEPGGRCPECGKLVSKRLLVRGRSRLRRFWWPAPLALFPPLAWGTLILVAGASRTPLASAWWSLPSRAAARETERRGWTWFDQFCDTFDVFEEWDMQAGKRRRTLRIGPGRTYAEPTLSADGKSILTMGRRADEFIVFSTESGATDRRLQIPLPQFRTPFNERAVTLNADDPNLAYIYGVDHPASEHVLYQWNLQTGESTTLCREPAWSYAPGRPVERRLYFTHLAEGPALASLPTFMESYNRMAFEVRVMNLRGQFLRSFEVTPLPNPHSGWVDPDTGLLFVAREYSSDIAAFDLNTGQTLGTLPDRGARGMSDSQRTAAGGRLLCISAFDDAVMLRDTLAREWLPTLVESTPAYGLSLFTSPQGHWVAARGQRDLGPRPLASPNQVSTDLIVWRLPDAWRASEPEKSPG
jgi:hypothetical protein